MFRNIETRDHYESRSAQAQHYAQNPELPLWLRNAWQAVADGRISSPSEYRDAPRAKKPAESRSMPRIPSTETIADKTRQQARERYLKLQGKRYDPYRDQD